ncbi:hypothetical protein [Pacificibacter marinus]|uniref:hypothetical protein n=1 Tax=Pacificibacter marinus TaxID=658057 RepID=UPI001C06CDA8|nr:hypothetical protein [Pacificibacter marinus]MBU2867813.1 hypothetical protein [Pacificibacter marinus]
MPETYRDKISDLISQLQQTDLMLDAKDSLRGLVDRIVLTPTEPEGKLSVHIHGTLAVLLSLSVGVKRKKCLSDKTQSLDNIYFIHPLPRRRLQRNLSRGRCKFMLQ